jgi:hypothetical protein
LCSQCFDESANKGDRQGAAEQWKENNLDGEIYIGVSTKDDADESKSALVI